MNNVAMNWETIKKEYESSDVTLKALAEKFGVKESTMRSRKNREKWQRNAKTLQRKNVATKKEPEPVIQNDDLTEKQKFFCLYYIKYWNATKAYMKAYGVERSTAESIAYRLMGNVGVKKEIDRLKAERQKGIYIDGMAVLQKYIDIAFADITDFVQFGRKEVPKFNIFTGEPLLTENGEQAFDTYTFVDVMNAEDVDGTIITEVKQGKNGIALKLADKMKALEMLAKYFDLLPDPFKRRIEEERLNLSKKKLELDERIVELREEEAKTKGW